jgi:transglutaminase-like putative cysteine protease
MGAFYSVEHETRYDYASPVSTSWHVAYLHPRRTARQRVPWHELWIDPRPARSTRRVDYFGNTTDQFTMLGPHTALRACGRSLVEVLPARSEVDPGLSPPWEEVRDALIYARGAPFSEAVEYAYPSPYVTLDPELAEFARASFEPGRPLLAGAIDLMHRIHTEFRFDPSVTTITTPVSLVLVERRGVCQDFAHLGISCLRSLGLAARYVSGYILTTPPPGQLRLAGADASHAWLSVHCPRHGWVDLDPTNDLAPELHHVTLGWGRDYGDVSPLRGVIIGAAQHTLSVGVSVIPLDTPEWNEALGTMRAEPVTEHGGQR